MLLSIFLYTFFGVIFFLIGQADKNVSLEEPRFCDKLTVFSWCFILLFTLISALRFRLGADCESYAMAFERGDYTEQFDKGEYLFVYMSQALNYFGGGRILLLGFWAFIEIFFFYLALKSRKFLIPFIGLIMMLGPFYYDMMNGIRQMTAACIFAYAVEQKIDYGKWKRYLFLIIISYFIHRSSIVLLLFLVLPNKDFFKNRIIVIALLIVCAFLGQSGWLLPYLNLGATMIEPDEMLGYDNYMGRMEVFTDELGLTMSYGPRRLVMLLVSLSIIWFYPEMQKNYNDKFLMFCYTGFVLYALFAENLLTAAHSSLSRPFLYFKLFKLICNAYLLVYLRKKYIKTRPLLYFAVLLLSIIYMPLDNIAVASDKTATTLFRFIFLR